MRQLARFGFGYAAGLLLAALLGEHWMPILFPAVLVGMGVGLAVRTLRRDHRFWCLLLAVLLAGGSFLLYTDLVYRRATALSGRTAVIEAEVVELTASGGYYRSELKLLTVDGEAAPSCRAEYLTRERPEVEYGDRVRMTARFSAVESDTLRLDAGKSHRVFLSVTPTEEELTVLGNRASVTAGLKRLRDRLHEAVGETMSPETAAVASGMLLGGRNGLSVAEQALYSRAGISHLFCVSGLHLSVVIQLTVLLLSVFHLRRRRTAVFGMLAVIGFVLLSGCVPSVLRAGGMQLLCFSGQLFRRRPNGLNSLGIACLPILLENPYVMYDVGFLLSLSATLGILLIGQPLTEWLCRRMAVKGRAGQSAVSLFAVSIGAVCGTLPVTLLCFEELSLVGLLLNPVINVFVTVTMFAGFGAAFLGLVPFLMPLAGLCGTVCDWAVTAITRGAELAVRLPCAYLPLGDGTVAVGVVLLGLGIVTGRWIRKKGRSSIGVVAAVVLSWSLLAVGKTAMDEHTLTLSVVRTEGAYGAFVRANGYCFVYGGTDAAASRALSRELRAAGVREIDWYLQPGDTVRDRRSAEELASLIPIRTAVTSEEAAYLQNQPRGTAVAVCPTEEQIEVCSPSLSASLSAESPALAVEWRGKRILVAEEWEDGGSSCLAAVVGSLPPDRALPPAEWLVRLTPQEDSGDRDGLIRGETFQRLRLVVAENGKTVKLLR